MNNQPAFPFVWHNRLTESDQISLGMTLRDYFAAKAMQGLLSCADWRESVDDHVVDGVEASDFTAFSAYAMSDAMLKAREA
jgi:hypothetical protein